MLELSLEDMQDENKDKIHVSMIEKEAFHSYYPNHPFDDPSIKVSFSNPKNALRRCSLAPICSYNTSIRSTVERNISFTSILEQTRSLIF